MGSQMDKNWHGIEKNKLKDIYIYKEKKVLELGWINSLKQVTMWLLKPSDITS